MFGGSRPKRALTIRATWPAGTIGACGAAPAGGAAGAGFAGGGGSATGCAAGGASCNGLDGVAGGASTLPPPGGTRLWLGIEPGGRGTESKPDGGDCANAGAAAQRTATQTATRNRRPR